MRKNLLLLFGFFSIALFSSAAVSPTKTGNPLPSDNFKSLTLEQFVHLSAKEYGTLTGKRMGLIQRAELKFTQKKMAKAIQRDASLKTRKISALKLEPISGATIAGVALGAFLGPIGVLIAYLINDDNKQERVRGAWRGFLIFATVLILTILRMS